ncbi:MAG: UdgX family uracil-DNA binding protein [Gemmatimonadales bacterium]
MSLIEGGASRYLPSGLSVAAMRRAVQQCKGCPLYRRATQAVFGEGRRGAAMMLVGEQPGNDEDRRGHPFVGPAGRVLDDALAQADIARTDTWVTNVVKHFKWEARGERRLHKKPGAAEIDACLPWLGRELAAVRPTVVVCLGATAAQALLGRRFRVTRDRGRDIATEFAPHTVATLHPSAILRQKTDADRHRAMRHFVADLRVAAGLLHAR